MDVRLGGACARPKPVTINNQRRGKIDYELQRNCKWKSLQRDCGKRLEPPLLPLSLPVAAPVAAAPVAAPAPATASRPRRRSAPAAAPAAVAAGETAVNSPMPGNIFKVECSVGQAVKAGDVLVVLEAMKMEIEVSAPVDGTVKAVAATVGTAVNTDDLLVTLG